MSNKVYLFLTGFYKAVTSIHTTKEEADDVMRRWKLIYENNYDENECSVEEHEVGIDPVPTDIWFHAKWNGEGWYVHATEDYGKGGYAYSFKDESICFLFRAESYADAVKAAPILLEQAKANGSIKPFNH